MVTGVPFPDWVMLNRFGRTYSHVDIAAAFEAAKKKSAVEVETATGRRFFLSFTLSDHPEGISYLDIEWPVEGSAGHNLRNALAYPYVRATDEDLVLFDISIPSEPRFYYGLPSDLFVYTADPSPSVQMLPVYAKPREKERPFLMSSRTTGILRLADDRYIVSDLNVYRDEKDGSDTCSMLAELLVFDSKSDEWTLFPEMPTLQLLEQSNGGQFPTLLSIDDVLAFDRRFLCWVDYLRGVVLCDFSDLNSLVLQFVPFPGGEEYSMKERCLAERFRHVSFSQGIMHFVHIDNEYHEKIHDGWLPQNITIWTLNMRDGNFKFGWKLHREINLDCLWKQNTYKKLGMCPCLPEFPVICAKEPDALCCLLRDEQLSTQPWMIMIDMNHAYLRSCTKYINQQPYHGAMNEKDVKAHQNFFYNVPLLPTVFSKYLVGQTGIRQDNKLATNPSKKVKLATHPSERALEDEDLECGDLSRFTQSASKDEDLECDDSDFMDAQIKDALARYGQPQVKIGKYSIDGMEMMY
jgi:hypothetical protein